MRVATKLAGLQLDDWSGERRRLDASWQKRPVVLVFILHFG